MSCDVKAQCALGLRHAATDKSAASVIRCLDYPITDLVRFISSRSLVTSNKRQLILKPT
jgi:hypothetical protein